MQHATLKRVVGNAAWLAIAETLGRSASLLAIIYVSRVLAPRSVGFVEFGLAVHAAMHVVAIGGAEVLLAREAARGDARIERLAGQNVLLAWMQLAPVYAAFLGLQLLLGRPVDLVRASALFGAAAAIAPLGMRFAFVAVERARVLGAGTAFGFTTYLALCVLLVHGPDQALRVGGAFVTAMAARHGLQFAIFVRRYGWPVIDQRGLASRLRLTTRLGVGSVARGLMLSVDVLVLGLLCAPADVAAYGLAAKVPLFLGSLAAFHYLALFPTLTRAIAAGDDRRAAAMQASSIAATLGVALPGALCLTWAASDLVSLLFTNRFAAAGPLLAVLVWRVPVATITGALRTALWASDPARDASIAVGLLLVTVGGLPVAALSGGPVGAALWMVACDAGGLAAYAWAARSETRPAATPEAVARLGIAIVVAGGMLTLVSATRGQVRVVVAFAVWGASAWIAIAPYVRRVVGAWRS